MPLTALAIGAAAGLIKNYAVDAPAAERQRTLAANTQRFSPWTGLKANPVKEADPLGSALTFGATGAQLGAGIQNNAAQNKLLDAQSRWLNSGGSPMASAATSGGLSGYDYRTTPRSFWGL